MGYNIGPTIAVNGEKEYAAQMKNIKAEMKSLKSETAALTSTYAANDKSIAALTLKNSQLQKAYDVQTKAVKAAEDALQRMKDQGVEPTSKAYVEMTENLNYAQAALNKTKQEMEANGNVLKRQGELISDAGEKIKKAGDKIAEIGTSLTTGVTTPIVAAGVAVTKFAMDFEDSMAKVSTLAGNADLNDLANQILNVSNAMGQSATSLAEAQYQAISAGVEATKSADFVATAAKVAVGGFTDTETAVDGLTTVMNAYGIATENVGEIANQFLVTQNKGKTTVGDLASSIGNVAATAQAAGVQTDELMASFAALTANGIKTSAAAAGLKAALSNIIKPTSEAAAIAAQLGIDFSASGLKAKGLQGFLDELAAATGGDVEVMGQLFGSVEALNAVLTLTSDSGAAIFTDSMTEMSSGVDAVDEAFQKVSNTANYKLKSALNEVKNAGIKLGQKLTPAVEEVADIISKLADKFGSLTDEQQKTIIKTAAVVAAIGPALIIIGKLTSGVGACVTMIGKLVSSMGAAGAAGAAAAGPAGWIALAAAAMIALGVAIDSVVKKNQEMCASATALADANDKARDTLTDLTGSLGETQTVTGATAERARELVAQIDALNKQSDTPEVLAQYKSVCSELNSLIPGLNLTIDEQTGHIDGTTAAIRNQIDAWEDLMIQQALQQTVTDLWAGYADAAVDVKIAEVDLASAQRHLSSVTVDLNQKYAELYEKTGLTYDEFNALRVEYRKGQTDASVYGSEVAALVGEIEGLQAEAKSTQGDIDDLSGAIYEGKQVMKDFKSAIDSATAALSAGGYAAGTAYGDGLVSGLTAKQRAVAAAAGALAEMVNKSSRVQMEIKSPSRKARRATELWGAGLEQGLEDSKRGVAAKAAELAAMITGTSPTIEMTAGATKRYATSVTLNVTDPSEAWLDYAFKKFNVKLGAAI